MGKDIKTLDSKIAYFTKALIGWARTHTRDLPWRNTADPYKICVAEIMLHQTGANKVAPVYQELIKKYPTVYDLSSANIRTLKRMLYTLGFLYRAERLRDLARYVVKKHGGQMPTDAYGLCSLPGVGQYTSSAIMCFAYGKDVPIFDTNVVRVYTRFFGLHRKLPNSSATVELAELAQKALPKGKSRTYNYAVLDFAAALCKHYSPACAQCPLANMCSQPANANSNTSPS